ncbi:hypothetical protein NEAUS05_1298 [Nematocida ausubeli]|nr:hypothetical protein NEAUS05_1298 [Nematocida ausubeli]
MKGTIIVCTMAVVLTVGYISMTHKAQTGRVLLEVISDLNKAKLRIGELLKKKKTGEKVEKALAGDLENIERKMEKIKDQVLLPEKSASKVERASSMESMKQKTGPNTIESTNLLSNKIVDQIIDSYLKGSLPMETITKAIMERPELLAFTPKLLGLNQLPLSNNIRASEIPTTLMKNIIEEQAQPIIYPSIPKMQPYISDSEMRNSLQSRFENEMEEEAIHRSIPMKQLSRPSKKVLIRLPPPEAPQANIAHMLKPIIRQTEGSTHMTSRMHSHQNEERGIPPSTRYIVSNLAKQSHQEKQETMHPALKALAMKEEEVQEVEEHSMKPQEKNQKAEKNSAVPKTKVPAEKKALELSMLRQVLNATEKGINQAILNSEISTHGLIVESPVESLKKEIKPAAIEKKSAFVKEKTESFEEEEEEEDDMQFEPSAAEKISSKKAAQTIALPKPKPKAIAKQPITVVKPLQSHATEEDLVNQEVHQEAHQEAHQEEDLKSVYQAKAAAAHKESTAVL